MVTDGWAMAYRKYSKDYVRAQRHSLNPGVKGYGVVSLSRRGSGDGSKWRWLS
jgi:hypothetical protein